VKNSQNKNELAMYQYIQLWYKNVKNVLRKTTKKA